MKSIPWTTVAVAVAVIVAVTVLNVAGDGSSGVITVLVGLLPAMLVGAGYAERNSKDLRNGLITEKAKDGATQALAETGVTDVAGMANTSTTLAMRALTELLDKVESKHPYPPDVPPTNVEGGAPSGGQTV